MTPRQVAALALAPEFHRQVGRDLPLDRWIGYAVKVLRDAGIETIESCDGSGGHAYREPTVRFVGTNAAGYRAVAAALDHGLPAFELRRVWRVHDSELEGPVWDLVFYPRSKLIKCQKEAERAGVLGPVGGPKHKS
jgi:hypothetical protein